MGISGWSTATEVPNCAAIFYVEQHPFLGTLCCKLAFLLCGLPHAHRLCVVKATLFAAPRNLSLVILQRRVATMGGNLGKALAKLFGNKEMRVLMLGLDAAGKTTILYKLKLGQGVSTIPTVGFNVETITFKKVKFNVWDVGGQDKIRPLWRHYYAGTQALIFVVDSNDRDRIDEARQELMRIINDREMKDAVLLVLANKNDLPNVMDTQEITDKLGLHKLRDRTWFVQSTCAISGDGLLDGLTWLNSHVK